MRAVNVPFKPIFCLIFATALMVVPETVKAQQDLAKKSQNPVGNLISVPFQNNTSFSEGPEDGTVNILYAITMAVASKGNFQTSIGQ